LSTSRDIDNDDLDIAICLIPVIVIYNIRLLSETNYDIVISDVAQRAQLCQLAGLDTGVNTTV